MASLPAPPVARGPLAGDAVLRRLPLLDRLLPLWILLAMALGLALGALAPGVGAALDALHVEGVSLPIALGLFWMLFPVLARVRYEALGRVGRAWRLFGASLVLNWLLGPALMFGLAWLLLPDLPAYRTGVILVGLARCIAMVLVWNELAGGDREAAAVLVALNSVFQVAAYAGLAYLYLAVLPRWLGLGAGSAVAVDAATVARNVVLFLGAPLVLGGLARWLGIRARGRTWYDGVLMPRLAPTALLALLGTVVLLFSLQGAVILARPGDVARVALPLVAYFGLMFGLALLAGWRAGLPYPEAATLAFTAAGNNFELAIAVAIATFGLASGEALAAVVGPLIEVPVLVALVYAALGLRPRLWPAERPDIAMAARAGRAEVRRRG
ncbi:MAG TPA: ACR3 family arsenite efflux transporter [Chloroflexota bacterium]|jgi:ACR3 family arsenite transporter|nr:ACR3 family arsenite efflux transporter [Chloroflexota bacterium]